MVVLFYLSSSLGCFHVGMLWYAIQWPMSGPWWVCHWLLGQHHTPGGEQEMKTSRQKRPRMCQLDFLWVFPTKIWFYVHCGPAGERVTESVVCGWSVGRQAGCDHVRPGVSVLYWPAQPPAGLPALSIAILQPDSSAYSPSEWSLALLSFRENKLSNVPWAER